MNNNIKSLCIYYENKLFRIADLKNNIFEIPEYNNMNTRNSPDKLNYKRTNVKKEQIAVFEWNPDNFNVIKTNENVFEIIFEENGYKIIDKLKDGIDYRPELTDDFLICIEKKVDQLRVIKCCINDFLIKDGRMTFRFNQYKGNFFHIYNIGKKDYIDSSNIIGYEGKERYFYSKNNIENTINNEKIWIKSIEDCIKDFLNNKLKANNNLSKFSLEQLKALEEIISEILDDNDDFELYLDKCGFSEGYIKSKYGGYNKLEDKLKYSCLKDDTFNDLLSGLIRYDKKTANQLEKAWKKTYKDKFDKISKEYENINKEKNMAEKELADIKDNINNYKSNNNFFADNQDYGFIKKHYQEDNASSDIIDICSLSDLKDCIYDNIEIMNINNQDDLSDYISAIIIDNMPTILIGCDNRNLANYISYSIDSKECEIYSIISNTTFNLSALYHSICNTEHKVILIENMVEDYFETMCLPLIKDNEDKLLLFSMENNEYFNLLPKSLFDYLAIINYNAKMNINNNINELRSGKLIIPNTLDMNKIDKNIDIIVNELCVGRNLSDNTKNRLSRINNLINKNNTHALKVFYFSVFEGELYGK